LEGGIGVERNIPLAVEYFGMAAAQACAEAQAALQRLAMPKK
jgi:TPR repeat protein